MLSVTGIVLWDCADKTPSERKRSVVEINFFLLRRLSFILVKYRLNLSFVKKQLFLVSLKRYSLPMRRFCQILILICIYLEFSNIQLHAAHSKEDAFVIRKIVYSIDGSTKEEALRALSSLEVGMSFPSLEMLEESVEDERQSLVNARVFKSVNTDIIQLSIETNIHNFVVIISVVDTITIIPIIYPKYDSNTGVRLGSKTYWDNFLGTMTNAYLGMGISFRPKDSGNKWEISEWNIDPSISDIRLNKKLFLSASMQQGYNEKEFEDAVDPLKSYHYGYYYTGLSVETSFVLYENLSYSVGLGTDFKYGYSGNLGPNSKRPYEFVPSHGLNYGRVDWIENFRKGFRTGLFNSYGFGVADNGKIQFSSSINASASYYLPFWKRFNLYTRLSAFYQWNTPKTPGSSIRGVRDNVMSGYVGAVLNTSLAFQFWRFEKVWDAQIHPFFDLGIVYNHESFNASRDYNYGIGFDLVLYLDALPSLVAVGSVGIDPKRFDKEEILSSLEISITSSLFY